MRTRYDLKLINHAYVLEENDTSNTSYRQGQLILELNNFLTGWVLLVPIYRKVLPDKKTKTLWAEYSISETEISWLKLHTNLLVTNIK